MREIMAAVWAHCADTFDDLPKTRRVDIVAAYEVGWRIDAVNAWEARRKPRGRH
jgi:hypothetical protein